MQSTPHWNGRARIRLLVSSRCGAIRSRRLNVVVRIRSRQSRERGKIRSPVPTPSQQLNAPGTLTCAKQAVGIGALALARAFQLAVTRVRDSTVVASTLVAATALVGMSLC